MWELHAIFLSVTLLDFSVNNFHSENGRDSGEGLNHFAIRFMTCKQIMTVCFVEIMPDVEKKIVLLLWLPPQSNAACVCQRLFSPL